jgi:hypothetical protein
MTSAVDAAAYAASDTTITPLGSAQTYQSGIQFREKYLVNDSSSAVAGVDWPLINLSEVDFMAESVPGFPLEFASKSVVR